MQLNIFSIIVFIVITTLIMYLGATKDTTVQSNGKVTYMNPKYITNISMLTSRKSRRAPYVTTINATILHNWTNNVSWAFEIGNIKSKGEKYEFRNRVCDGFKWKWVSDYVHKTSDIIASCPVKKGVFHIKLTNEQLIPRGFPIPSNFIGSYHVMFTLYITDTKENITSWLLYFERI